MTRKLLWSVFGVVFISQAQTLRIYSNNHFWVDHKVNQIDSISLNSMNDLLSIYGNSNQRDYSTNLIDSVKFIKSDNFTGTYGELIDSRDGQTYKTVVIGSQEWMAQNLNFGVYMTDSNSGTVVQNGAQKFCYDNLEINCNTYGALYQWHTAMGFGTQCATTYCSGQINISYHQGICPVGWHIPKGGEWDVLQAYLGGATVAASKMKMNNTGYASWDYQTYNTGNDFGFSALASGSRFSGGSFSYIGRHVYYWEANESYDAVAYSRQLTNVSSSLTRLGGNKLGGMSVRCLKD